MGTLRNRTIRVLLVEDVEAHAELALHQFRRAGVNCISRRVETGPDLIAALHEFAPSVILSDFSLPEFDGLSALRTAREHAPQVPFIFVSGTIGEERAIGALRAGAADYVLKENLARLVPAVERAIGDAEAEAQRVRQEVQIARLNRVLRMLSGVNDLVIRIRDRTDLLRETCRLAVSLGGYAMAVAATRARGGVAVKAVASNGADDEMTARLRAYVEESGASESSVVGGVFRSGREFVCNNTGSIEVTARFDALMIHTGLRSAVVLPLVVDGVTSAVLLLTARDSGMISEEELAMLREVAGNLSFGLQYVQRDTKVRFLELFDAQTGLARRSLFCERVQEQIAAPASQSVHNAIIVLDIERLSIINDSFGRRTGDLLLQQVSNRLKHHYPKSEQLAHFGGGMFALLRDQGSRTDAEILANGNQQTQKLFGEPFEVDGRSIPLTVRVGYSLCPEDGTDATTLVQNAEAALRFARATGQRYVQFNAAARAHSVGQMALEHRLRFALERKEFELHYQPKVNVVTRRIQGAEALLRWRNPEDGLVAPGAFLPALESSGLILDVGQWVIEQAARDCRNWRREGLPPVRVAVNIAPAQLRHHDFEQGFLQATRPWATRTWGLDAEITEGVLQDDSDAEIRVLSRLREAGMKVAIDDFGTGYSSLSRLASLPIDTLKIDRSFVRQSVGDPAGASLVRTIVALARTFRMTTVAEGVERQEELDLLWQMGCDQSQGYLHCAPVPADEFAVLLRNGRGVLMQPAEVEAPEEGGETGGET